MIERFQYYLDENLTKKSLPEPGEAISLMEKSLARLAFIKSLKVDESNSTFVFEETYESIREAAQSLMSLKGYKPYSHEALISFLKEFHNFVLGEIDAFDRYRILRNNCVYRAEKVSATTCKESIEFAEAFIPKIKREFDKKTKK